MFRILLPICIAVIAASCLPCALAQQTFVVGQKVRFTDPSGKYGGGIIPGTIMKDRGAAYPFPENRYEIQVDLPGAPLLQSLLIGAAAMVDGAKRAPVPQVVAPIPQVVHPVPQFIAPAPQAAEKPKAAARELLPINPHSQGDWGKPPAKGTPFNYSPNTNQGIGNNAITPPGLQPMYVGTPPGDESAVGRWYTHVGGVFTHKDVIEYDGQQKSIWSNSEIKELINVMPGGLWEMNDYGRITTGKWYDIGQNVIRLVNLTPGHDWTASVWHKKIQFRSGHESREGNRY